MRTIRRDMPKTEDYLGDDYLTGGLGEVVYPYWRTVFGELFDRDDPPVMVIDGAIGTGKTFLLRLAFLRVLYEVLEAGGASAYGLAVSEHIHIVVCGSAHDLAALDKSLGTVPYYRHLGWSKTSGMIDFPGRRVRVVVGKPDDSALLGLNICALLADGMNGEENVEQTVLTMRAVQRRLVTRARLLPGLMLYVGAGHKTTTPLAGEAGVIHHRPALWDVEHGEGEREVFRVVIPNHGEPYIATGESVLSPDMDASVLAIPEDYRREFEGDLEGSLRDLAGEPIA